MIQGMNYQLNDTYNLLRDSVIQFARREIAPLGAEKIDKTNQFPREFCGRNWENWAYWELPFLKNTAEYKWVILPM